MNAKMIMSQLNERRSIAWALGLRIELLSPATCSWVQQEAARRAGSLADNTEFDGEWHCPASQRRESHIPG